MPRRGSLVEVEEEVEGWRWPTPHLHRWALLTQALVVAVPRSWMSPMVALVLKPDYLRVIQRAVGAAQEGFPMQG